VLGLLFVLQTRTEVIHLNFKLHLFDLLCIVADMSWIFKRLFWIVVDLF